MRFSESFVPAVLTAVAVGCGSTISLNVEIPPPPETAALPVSDTLHGVELVDPFRWLEDGGSEDTKTWVEQQNAYTDSILAQLPERDAIREDVARWFDFDSVGAPTEAGGRYFFTRRKAGQDQDVLVVREGADGEERVLIDPHGMSDVAKISVHLQSVSADGKRLVYLLRSGGMDEGVLRVLDVDRGEDLPDVLPLGLYLVVTMHPDGRGFYYATFGMAGPRLMYHRLGTEPSTDSVVFGEGTAFDELLWPFVSEDGRWLVVNVLKGSTGPTRIYLKDLRKNGRFRRIAGDGKSHSYAFLAGDHLLVTTDLDAPNRRVMLASLQHPEQDQWRELIPERTDAVIEQATGVGGRVMLSYLKDVQPRVALYDLDGGKVSEVEFPTIGTVFWGSGRWSSPEVFLSFTSFHVPPTVYRLDTTTGGTEMWEAVDLPVDSAEVEVHQEFYTSADGTRVPMFVVHRAGLEKDGRNPTVLSGYGGLSLSVTPTFSPIAAAWVHRGGVWASANLRGGGEFGEAWHEAGMLANKQNTFDDYVAAAEFLASAGYSSREHLAAFGGSNGGLTVGALLTQRPDVVNAVVCTFPVLDMIRYHQFLLGRYWVSEYGSSDDPEQFRYLLDYSPYHNVEEGAHFPATLFVTGEMDTRVDPLHARKMAAMVQSRNASDKPILLRYQLGWGHAAAPPMGELVEEATELLSFLLWQTG